jgi:hypothetical protein
MIGFERREGKSPEEQRERDLLIKAANELGLPLRRNLSDLRDLVRARYGLGVSEGTYWIRLCRHARRR